MASILNNISAISANRNLAASNAGLGRTINRLSTGLRINQARDDAAGLAISNRLDKDVRVFNQAIRNANDGIGLIQVVDKAYEEITNLLTRAAELSEQSASDTSGDDGSSSKLALNDEFSAIKLELSRFDEYIQFNGKQFFAASVSVGVAVGEGQKITVVVDAFSAGAISDINLAGTISTAASAEGILSQISDAISIVSRSRARLGATQARLETTISTLGVLSESTLAASSQIRDADIASEVVNLTKFQVLVQAGTSALAQANSAAQNVLSLLR